jgi:threonine synthase
MGINCSNCGSGYPEKGTPYKCNICGGFYSQPGIKNFDLNLVDNILPGLWRYKNFFNLDKKSPVIHLGEGDTPLVWANLFNREIGFKLEYLNPTNSFKDRGSSVLVSFLKSRDVIAAVDDSSGNAGSSFSAYAVRANIKATIFIPEYASGPKRKQIEAYGADIKPIPGPRSAAADEALRAADSGTCYASHVYFPIGIDGIATIAFEIFQQLHQSPGTIILPVGQGSLFLGIIYGFTALLNNGYIDHMPKIIGVQARACAPIWAVHHFGAQGLSLVSEGETIAEGIRSKHPLRGDVILELLEKYDCEMLAVDEDEIKSGQSELAKSGFYVEPTSAVVYKAIEIAVGNSPDPIITILSGSGLKSSLT